MNEFAQSTDVLYIPSVIFIYMIIAMIAVGAMLLGKWNRNQQRRLIGTMLIVFSIISVAIGVIFNVQL